MAVNDGSKSVQPVLPIILVAAVAQGWLLYWLHRAIEGSFWPATQPGWLLALYAVVVFIPLTVQMLAEHARSRAAWLIVAAMAALFWYFGWHHGANVMDARVERFASSGAPIPIAFALGVLWLLMLPFIQCRLVGGRWQSHYPDLFATAWRNKLTLAEAALFTGLFWLLLVLWAQLFRMLGIRFFEELFEKPIFIYPVTSLAFGIALFLIGSVERLVSVVLEQVLSVLKWLMLLAGVILALFTVALAFRLPDMIASGQRAIGAAWLLWLVAVMVLLVNAAYRDGSVEQPYPRWLAVGLRGVVPLLVVVAATGVYALYLRIDAFGFTVERVWACVVAALACVYAGGYTFAAVKGRGWMGGMDRINVAAALCLIAVLGLALTPVLSPYRLTANSQFLRAQELPPDSAGRADPFNHLRFGIGAYGEAKLRELANLQDHPRAAEIRARAAAAIAQPRPGVPAPPDSSRLLANMAVHPAGRSIDASLKELIAADLDKSKISLPRNLWSARMSGVFVDLDADQVDEFVVFAAPFGYAYGLQSGNWQQVGTLTADPPAYNENMSALVEAGNVSVIEPDHWRRLKIGQHVFRMRSTD
jgi:hypothetical protein